MAQERSLPCVAELDTEHIVNTLGDGEASDPELEELLDKSLGEFGKHVPQPSKQPDLSATDSSKATTSTSTEQPHPGEFELGGLLSSELMSEMESQFGEAMTMISNENPELWQQFNTFTKSMDSNDFEAGPVPPLSGTTTKGESSVDANSGATGSARVDGGGKNNSDHLDRVLNETLKNLQENTSQPGGDGLGGLGDVLSQLDLGSEKGEDQFMKMMQGMMSTLLSKDVLYPSLVDLYKQYPDWIASNRASLSEEDFRRYSKQMEIITAICSEFEKPSDGAEPSEGTSEKILQLMQELQRYGQLPEGLAGDAAGMPPGLMGSLDSQKCSIM